MKQSSYNNYFAFDEKQNCFLKKTPKTYRNQSTTSIKVTSSIGNPTAARTITMVTRPACGTPAAPIEAAVAVILKAKIERSIVNNQDCIWISELNEYSITLY